ncbi:MAG: alpha-amylase family glycosyl hydrolase [Chloroflexi bacterium]|nr:alpha-amylase family glycosyl hydrolase [Chloroflexota bacterium]
MRPAVLRELELLYGKTTATVWAYKIDAVVRERADAIRAARRNRLPVPLDERTALVITYPDQVRQPGVPPLQSLATLLDRHLASIVSGAHILPFFPSSSDDGFSVMDYGAVNPAFGIWDDISSLGERFDLMIDGVINHVSAQSAWFKGWLEDQVAYQKMFIPVDDGADVSKVVRPRALPLTTQFETALGPRRLWTTFGPDQVDLDYHNPDVLLRVLDTLLAYVEKGARS